jgi:RNA polymerase sigma-70 factor (sigma-E family)
VSTFVRRAGVAMQAAEIASSPVAPNRDEAIGALFAAEAPRLIALAHLLTGERAAAEDLVQDAFVTLYRRWAWLRDKDSAKDYVRAAVVNGSRLALRRRYSAKNLVRRVQQEGHPDAPSAETTALLGETRRELRAALTELSVRQRQVVLLRYYADLSEREIADILNISRGSVKRHASRALDALTHVLEASS